MKGITCNWGLGPSQKKPFIKHSVAVPYIVSCLVAIKYNNFE